MSFNLFGASQSYFGANQAESNLVEACQKGYADPSAENLKAVEKAVGAYGEAAAKGAVSLVPTSFFMGRVWNQFIEGLSPKVEAEQEIANRLQSYSDMIHNRTNTDKENIRHACTTGISTLISEAIGEIPDSTTSSRRYRDPLILDLDGDGVEINAESVYFDTDGDGIANKMSWANADDGFLVYDKNQDGEIADGSELFGDDYTKLDGTKAKDGFDALRDLDANNDNVINASDTNFESLQVWRDLNQDGVTDAGELFSLQDLGISEIQLTETLSGEVKPGYQEVSSASIVMTDGSESKVYDVNLEVNSLHTKFDHSNITLDESVLNLANITGMGSVDTLHYSMAENEQLKQLITNFSESNSRSEQLAFMDQIVNAWASTNNEDTLDALVTWQVGTLVTNSWVDEARNLIITSTGVEFHSQELSAELSNKINLLSSFFGNDDFKNVRIMAGGGSISSEPVESAFEAVANAYEQFQNNIYELLVGQTRLNQYFDKITVDFESEPVISYQALETFIQNEVATTPDKITLLEDIVFLIKNDPIGYLKADLNLYDYVNELISIELTPEVVEVLEKNDFSIEEYGFMYHSTGLATDIVAISADNVNEVIINGDNKTLVVGSGNDDLITVNGANTIVLSGEGNDEIIAGSGNDIV
ncbi:hypothetical protein, partial [Psychromonas sp. Urea-02u-13]|uniref:hypothetical protein n=1 Tax=Psychromonas sp. Urea-02u-13 TaxID=2058326 RepID=UPI000CB7BA6A